MGLSQGGSSGGGGGSGEANTTSNLGTGAQLAAAKVGVNLPIRSIVGGANISATQNANDVTLAITGTIPAGNQAPQTLAGDVTGPTNANVVVKINGASVPVSGAIAVGNSLYATGPSTLAYGALNLAGGSNYVTGVLPTANQAEQSMAGDVTGTTAASVVSKVRGATIVTAAGALTTGYSLRATGVSAADWGPIDLANANATTGALPPTKGGTGLTSVGAANTVLTSSGTAGVWATIVDANVSASAGLTWSKFGGSTQVVNPTGFDHVGRSKARQYYRCFEWTTATNTTATVWSFTLPDSATTVVTIDANMYVSTSGGSGNTQDQIVLHRNGATVTTIATRALASNPNVYSGVTISGTTCNVRVGSANSSGDGSVRVEVSCGGTAALPGTL